MAFDGAPIAYDETMKLLLIDDHALFRDGLSLLIQHRLNLPEHPSPLLLEAGDLAEAAKVLEVHPDVSLALLDLNLGAWQGIETLQQWRVIAPDVPVVVLSANDCAATIVAAIGAGAAGFIPKTAQVAIMQGALQCVLAGGVCLPDMPCTDLGSELPSMLDDAGLLAFPAELADVTEPAEAELPESLLGLSGRQLDVLRLLIEGKPNKEICRMMGLSESTVKTHLSATFRKLNVSSRTQAVVAVARAGVALGPLSRKS